MSQNGNSTTVQREKTTYYCFWLCVIQVQFLLTETESPFYLLFLVVLFIYFGYLKCPLHILIPMLNTL